MIRDAIDFYHSLLDDQDALEAQAALARNMLAGHLYFGTRPICTVLRPYFYEPDHWEYLLRVTLKLLSAFGKAHQACMTDDKLRAQLALEPWEEELIHLNIGPVVPWTTSRLDSFFAPDAERLWFVEYNAETPAGMGYADRLSEAFLSLDVMRRFSERYIVRSFTTLRSLMATLLDTFARWGGRGAPQIGIVDWADVPTLNEHEIIREFLAERHVKARLADPRALEYHDGHLWAGDFRVDLVYKRVLASELVQRTGLHSPIMRALRDGAVCMTNSFSAKIMAKKASFALVSDERNAGLFSQQEREAIEAHIPWTRRVEERKTQFHGQPVDLVPFIAENRKRLVLKPNDEYGGKGVTIGWECGDEVWAAALREALNEPSVVQERVEAHSEEFPAVVNGKLDISERLVDADPYIYHGRTVGGCLTRLSSVALLNVTAGGGSVAPTFIVMKKR